MSNLSEMEDKIAYKLGIIYQYHELQREIEKLEPRLNYLKREEMRLEESIRNFYVGGS